MPATWSCDQRTTPSTGRSPSSVTVTRYSGSSANGTSILTPPCETSRVVTIFGAGRGLEQGRAGQLDARHAPALAGLADDVLGDHREHVDLPVEAQADLRAAPPGDDAVELLAGHQLELEPFADLDRMVDMEDRAAGAELADRADVADAARGQRARPQATSRRLGPPASTGGTSPDRE